MEIDIALNGLWTHWIPEIEQLDGRYRLCRNCKEKQALPFAGICQGCLDASLASEDKKIQRRKHSGFSDTCLCGNIYADVWVIGSSMWIVRRRFEGKKKLWHYTIDRSVGHNYASLCTACIEKKIAHPYTSDECVIWTRDIRYVRKTAEVTHDTVTQSINAILNTLDF